jgi:hypothetical protein
MQEFMEEYIMPDAPSVPTNTFVNRGVNYPPKTESSAISIVENTGLEGSQDIELNTNIDS